MRTFLSLNYGSSSLKYAKFAERDLLFKETIQIKGLKDLKRAIIDIRKRITEEPYAVVHRVVHGMDYKSPMPINNKNIKILEKLSEINPLHNSMALYGIKLSLKIFPKSRQYSIFDTDFHRDIPEYAKLYGIDLKFYRQGIKRYGFHGISYSYLLKKSIEILKNDKPNLIIMHLGSGCSVSAIKEGKPIETSMGFSPLEGLIMSTRSGDLDPGVILYLLKRYKPEQIEKILYRKSGIKGIFGSEDFREVIKSRYNDPNAKLAFLAFLHRLIKYVGSYWFVLDGKVDAIVFSGGIGENSPELREELCQRISKFGVYIDKLKNLQNQIIISSQYSPTKILNIKTDEESEMINILLEKIGPE